MPEGFLEEPVSENVIAGNVMGRRASYIDGALLPRGPQGDVDARLGKGIPLLGTPGLLVPTHTITASHPDLLASGGVTIKSRRGRIARRPAVWIGPEQVPSRARNRRPAGRARPEMDAAARSAAGASRTEND